MRTVININEAWRFMRQDEVQAADNTYNDENWEEVNIPHTWNAVDGANGFDYHKGACWYRKNFTLKSSYEGCKVFIEFNGSNSIEIGDVEKLEEVSEESNYLFCDIPNRVPNDPLRSGKNLAFVLNTLLRKATEKGGVHPMDIHSISEKYAVQIEQTNTILNLGDLLKKMRLDYCYAVKKLSLKNFNYLTQKAIEFIRKNLDGNLSLEAISSAIDVSPYELSRQFNKETGHNITEYINIQRINEALYIMQNPSISITDTAYMVGFNDVTYFSKVFKKLKGITPSEYRKIK